MRYATRNVLPVGGRGTKASTAGHYGSSAGRTALRHDACGHASLGAVGSLGDIAALEPFRVWDGVVARAVEGERCSFAVVELEPSCVVPEHRHDNEQLGMVLRGSVSFRIG